jgi:ribosome-associated protein
MSDAAVVITPALSIPAAEITYRASRSGGPGGQHVNTSSTRVELVWDVVASSALTEEQRALLMEKLSGRINADGKLALASTATRSQHRNRDDVTERFATLVREALEVPRARRKTKPTKASREERLRSKKRRSETKRIRSSRDYD